MIAGIKELILMIFTDNHKFLSGKGCLILPLACVLLSQSSCTRPREGEAILLSGSGGREVFVASTRADLEYLMAESDDLVKKSVRDRREAMRGAYNLSQELLAGRGWFVPPATGCEVLKVFDKICEIRITEGEREGYRGWVRHDLINQ